MPNENLSLYREKIAMIFSTRSLKTKLFYSFAILFGIAAFSSVTAIYSISKIQDKMKSVETIDRLTTKLLLVRQKEKNFLLYGNVDELRSAQKDLFTIRDGISSISPEARTYFRNVPGLIRRYEAVMKKFIHGTIKPDLRKNLMVILRTRGHELMETMLSNGRSLKNRLNEEVNLYKELSIILLWVALPVGLLFCICLAEWIVEPLGYVRKKAGEIMSGKLKAIPLEPIADKCAECDKLVKSINLMLDTIECKQEQLVQSEKLAAIGKVTAGIAHEINNPLNNINLTAEVLLESVDEMDSEERAELIRDILSQTERARDIVHHLLSFSRKKTAVMERINLTKVLENTLHFLKNEMRLSKVTLKTHIESNDTVVSGNQNQLEQVLINIILNAIQAMTQGGQLEIGLRTDKKHGRAIITVKDNGPGMSKEIIRHILEPFYTTKKEGTGLGLSVSYGIIKDHNGDIKIESKEGRGTVVKIILPLADKSAR